MKLVFQFPILLHKTKLFFIKLTKQKTGYMLHVVKRELRFGMQWSVEYSLGINDNFLTQRVIFHNPGNYISSRWMSWSNAALPSAPDTRYDFPKGKSFISFFKDRLR